MANNEELLKELREQNRNSFETARLLDLVLQELKSLNAKVRFDSFR